MQAASLSPWWMGEVVDLVVAGVVFVAVVVVAGVPAQHLGGGGSSRPQLPLLSYGGGGVVWRR